MSQPHTPNPFLPARSSEPARAISPVLCSGTLFGAAQTLFIDHAGQRYTLRITRENKLILTK